MKKVSAAQKMRLCRLRRIRTTHAQHRRDRKAAARRFFSSAHNLESQGAQRKSHQRRAIRISAPTIFTLIDVTWRKRLLSFLSNVRRATKSYQQVTLDFSPIKRLHPCGTLLFVAEITRLLDTFKCKFRATRPRDEIVEQMFQHLGLLGRLGVTHRLSISHKRVRNWTYHSGTDVDLTSLENLKERLDAKLGDDLAFDLLSAMQEAITNAVHHAYVEVRPDGIKCKNQGWWLFAEYSDEGVMYLSVCDLGVGIRRTLPRRSPWPIAAIESVLQRLGTNTSLDAKYIKAAIELGATRTGKGNRGKGLHEMLELVKAGSSGGLRIFSDRGMYTYNGSTGVEKILDYGQSIMGTLIQWSFNTKAIGAQDS